MSIPIVPAIIPESAEHVISLLSKLTFAREIQLDLVDGQYVTSSSWPYDPTGDPASVRHETDKFTLEVDLMVKEPLSAARAWVAAGADMIVFHQPTISLEAFTSFTESSSVSVGVAVHGPLTDIFMEYAAVADYIQLMGIREIGAQGLPFDEAVLERVEELRRMFPNKMISVDGSVNQATIMKLKRSGVTRMIVGSAIVKQENPAAAYQVLNELINT